MGYGTSNTWKKNKASHRNKKIHVSTIVSTTPVSVELTCSQLSENNIDKSRGIFETGKSHVANNSNGKLGGRSFTSDRNVAFNVSVVVDHSESI